MFKIEIVPKYAKLWRYILSALEGSENDQNFTNLSYGMVDNEPYEVPISAKTTTSYIEIVPGSRDPSPNTFE